MVRHALEAGVHRIAPIVRDCVDPRRVLLFGSRARGDAHADSDFDVYVEVDDDAVASGLEQRLRAQLGEAGLRVDVFVRSKRRFDERRDDPGSVEWDVDREGVVLFARAGATPARVFERPREHASVAEWLAKADPDFQVIDILLAARGWPAGPVAFHAHAGSEKLLKALIVRTDRRPQRTHSLGALLAQCPSGVRDALAEDAAFLDALFPGTEYPDQPGPSVSEEQALRAVAASRRLRDVVRPSLVR